MAFCSLCFILTIIICSNTYADRLKSMDPHQKANYHLRMLRENVERIKRSWRSNESPHHPSHVFKRSTNKYGADGLVLKSLASYCNVLGSDPDITDYLQKSSEQQPLKFRDLSGYSRYNPDGSRDSFSKEDDSKNNGQNIIPVQVLAQRDEDTDKVWYMFYIAHSTTVEIARLDKFHFEKTTLKMPSDACHKIVSKARFAVDASNEHCLDKNGLKERRATFQITDTDGQKDIITMQLNMCNFDRKWKNWEQKIVKKEGITSDRHISIPTISMSPSNNDIVQFQNVTDKSDSEMTFDLNVNLSFPNFLKIYLVLWDKLFKNIVQFSATVRYGAESKIIILYSESNDSGKMFKIHVESKRKLRLSLNKTQIQDRKGRLTLSYKVSKLSKRKSDYGPLVESIGVDRSFPINTADASANIPEEQLVYFKQVSKFFCDEKNGNRNNYGALDFDNKNCTVECQAFGRDISTIYITTPLSVKKKVQTSSVVLARKAIAVVNLGIASYDIEGSYQCTAVNGRGKTKTQELKLYTSRFTRIISFDLETNDLKTLRLLCKINLSDENVDIAISAGEVLSGSNVLNKIRLDNVEGLFLDKQRTYNTDEDTSTLSLLISWEQVKFPIRSLYCDARGERGDDTMIQDLIYYYQHSRANFPDSF